MLRQASISYFLSEGLKGLYEQQYPEYSSNFDVLVHPVRQRMKEDVRLSPVEWSLPVKALMIGNFNESNIDATRRIIKALGPCEDIEIAMATQVPKSLLKVRGLNLDSVKFLGYLSEDALEEELKNADLFLLSHGFAGGYSEEEYRTIFPTRVVTYLTYEKPILAHVPENSFLADFLRGNNCASIVTEKSEHSIFLEFKSLVSDKPLRDKLARNAKAASHQFDSNRVVEKIIKDIASRAG